MTKRLCEIDGCEGTYYGHGLCDKHYRQARYKKLNPPQLKVKLDPYFYSEQTYKGTKCAYDGTRWRYSHTHKCVECARYKRAIASGLINGIDGRKAHLVTSSEVKS